MAWHGMISVLLCNGLRAVVRKLMVELMEMMELTELTLPLLLVVCVVCDRKVVMWYVGGDG